MPTMEIGQMNKFVPLEEEVYRLLKDALCQTANRSDLNNFHRLLQQCRRRLQEPMRVAIVGVIKAGKSTLMNALLQEKIVATGAVEATFNVNWLKYGESSSLKVYFKDDRPPEVKSFSELKALTLRPEKYQDYLLSIKYIEVAYPNEILRNFNIIDTPGLKSCYEADSKNTQNFLQLHGGELTNITQQEAANADAVLYLFSQGLSEGDAETVRAFQGSLAGNATPINAIGVLTKVDIYATDPNISDPMAAGRLIASRLCQNAQVSRLFYTIYPICGLLAEGAQTLTDEHFEILSVLSKLPEKRFVRLSRYVPKFLAEYEPEDIPLSQEQRALLHGQLGLYGIIQAYYLLNSGIEDREQLIAELIKKTGIPELRQLILSHFDHRAFSIKLAKVLQDISAAYFQQRQHLQGEFRLILETITGQFDSLQAQAHCLRELEVLRSYYDRQLNFDEREQQQLLEVTGEFGTLCGDRLGLGERATVDEMLTVSEERMRYWNQRANDTLGSDRSTIAAAKVLARSYERILYRVQRAKQYLYI